LRHFDRFRRVAPVESFECPQRRQASNDGVVTSAAILGTFVTLGSDSPARVPNRFTNWPSALKASSFLAADACSSSRTSPVRQFFARKSSMYSLSSLVIEPSTTAAFYAHDTKARISGWFLLMYSERRHSQFKMCQSAWGIAVLTKKS
jgi:hypothetical protein